MIIMRTKILAALGALGLLLGGAALAQVTIPYVTSLANADAVQVVKGGSTVSGNTYATMLQLQAWVFGGSSQRTGATAPALTSCGSSAAPSILGNDYAGTVTMGGSTPSGCVITFNTAYTSAPTCTVTSRSQLASFAYTVSTAAITTTQTATSSNLIDYVCVAKKGT